MKEMVYGLRKRPVVLYSGEYKGHKFVILNLWSHPTAYVENKMGITDYNDCRLDNVKVHGGFTYCDTGYWNEESKKTSWIGWDYAHCGDYLYGYTLSGKQWTTAEIYEEVKSVIDQIIAVENERLREKIAGLSQEIAELRERLEKAVELPCKVGDTIYEATRVGIYEWEVESVYLRKNMFQANCVNKNDYKMHWNFIKADYCNEFEGKGRVRVNRLEAEARLAELKGGKQ